MGAVTFSNEYFERNAAGEMDWSADIIGVILMQNLFAFDPDTHNLLADVTASQLATGNGYTQDTKQLSNVVLTRDDANNRLQIDADNVIWTASGGTIGPTPGAIFYNKTSADKFVIGYDEFSTTRSASTGSVLQIGSVRFYHRGGTL
jgi:hypothetical protein